MYVLSVVCTTWHVRCACGAHAVRMRCMRNLRSACSVRAWNAAHLLELHDVRVRKLPQDLDLCLQRLQRAQKAAGVAGAAHSVRHHRVHCLSHHAPGHAMG